ncbi:unnamed protein product [Ixodes pacificus]
MSLYVDTETYEKSENSIKELWDIIDINFSPRILGYIEKDVGCPSLWFVDEIDCPLLVRYAPCVEKPRWTL